MISDIDYPLCTQPPQSSGGCRICHREGGPRWARQGYRGAWEPRGAWGQPPHFKRCPQI